MIWKIIAERKWVYRKINVVHPHYIYRGEEESKKEAFNPLKATL